MAPTSQVDIDFHLIEPLEDSEYFNRERLKLEMERILLLLGISESFNLEWKPQARGRLAGEVKNQTVYIYVHDITSAMSTVRHEIVDYWLTQLLQAPLDWSDAAMQGLSDMIEALRIETTISPTLRVVISKLAGLINLYTRAFTETLYAQKEERIEALCRLVEGRSS